MRLTGTVAALLAAGVAQAQQVLMNELSFGYQGRCVPQWQRIMCGALD